VHKVKNPKQYGGWSQWMRMWAISPLIGLIISIIYISDKNPVKNAQAKSLCFGSILIFILWAFLYASSN